ncbi:hypothetical protein ACPZ19_26735 [Amycolatopsis lurida]
MESGAGGKKTWPSALADLVQRRAERFHDVLNAAVRGFDPKLDRVLDWLEHLPGPHPSSRMVLPGLSRSAASTVDASAGTSSVRGSSRSLT